MQAVRTHIKSKLIGNLTPDEYAACRRLNLGDWGLDARDAREGTRQGSPALKGRHDL